MNKVIKKMVGDTATYTLRCENGIDYPCTRWYEKKTDAWHVKLPKDNPSGRTYIRESLFDNIDEINFETKTEFRTGLVTYNWKSRMTPEEKVRFDELETEMENLRKTVMSRPVKELTKEEKLERDIAKLNAELNKLRGNKIEG